MFLRENIMLNLHFREVIIVVFVIFSIVPCDQILLLQAFFIFKT